MAEEKHTGWYYANKARAEAKKKLLESLESNNSQQNKKTNSASKSSTKSSKTNNSKSKNTTANKKVLNVKKYVKVENDNVSINTAQVKKDAKKQIKKQVKGLSVLSIVLVVSFFVLGFVGGYFGYKFLIKNDEFVLEGDLTITVSQNEQIDENLYNENSVKLTIFGKEAKDKLIIKIADGGIDTSKTGIYYITYSTSSLRFYGVTLQRKILVTEAQNG